MYVLLWRFRPLPGREADFERAYGPEGVWAELFRRGEGYSGTVLLRSAGGSGDYVTIDRWESREAYEAFRSRWAAEYAEIDRRLETLTEMETSLGTFEEVPGAR